MIRIEPLSTKALRNGSTEYNFRNEADIRRFVYFTLKGNRAVKPVLTGARGFRNCVTNPDGIAEEMIALQYLYNKTSGLRVQGLILTVTKDELSAEHTLQGVGNIAYRFTDYIFLSGFQTAYGVFDSNDHFDIYYAINTVSYANGMKFRQNHREILADEQLCAETILADIAGKPLDVRFDFESLEYS